MLSTREWRRNRDRAGVLLGLVYKAPKGEAREKAWRIYRDWADARITFEEAKRRLERLSAR